jgi:hypothetical protein
MSKGAFNVARQHPERHFLARRLQGLKYPVAQVARVTHNPVLQALRYAGRSVEGRLQDGFDLKSFLERYESSSPP